MKASIPLAFALFALTLPTGCSEPENAKEFEKPPEPVAGQSIPAYPKASGETADLGALEKAQTAAADAFKKDQSDAVKKAYVEATVKLATATMNAPELAPKEKYPKALKLYRQVLQFDSKNVEAKENSDTIVEIYKSMGRPVPE